MDKKFIIGTVIATLLILVGSIWAAYNLGNSAIVEESADAVAEFSITTHDWGEIDIMGGKVEKIFPIKNAGTDVLKLFNISTSCMCTTAQLVKGDSSSPLFGMHAPSEYVMDLAPGEEAELKVVFDPLFHGPDAVGAITRTVTVETNDPSNKSLFFTTSGKVIKQ